MGLHWGERSYLLIFFDILMLCSAMILAFWLQNRDVLELISSKAYWLVTFVTIWFCLATIMRSYDMSRCLSFRSVFEAGMAAAIAGLVYQIIPLPFITPTFPARRAYALILPIMAFSTVFSWRYLYARLFSHVMFKRRLLVVGAGRSGETLVRQLIHEGGEDGEEDSGYQILGFVDDDPNKTNKQIDGHSILGTSKGLLSLCEQLKPDEIVVAITNLNQVSQELFEAMLRCRARGFSVTTMPTLYERLAHKIPLNHVGRNLQVLLPLEQDPIYRLYMLLKRLSDIAFGIVGLVVLVLVMPFIWLLNMIYSRGPLFFKQERVGHLGSIFTVYKFRTMNVDAEKESGAVWCNTRDPRITKHGHFMRKTRIDELPQMLNVLRGEMTLIGPRPERPQFVSHLEKEVPFYGMRHAHKPGLTGWAQVNYPYGASVEDSFQKLQYDLYYLKHQGFMIDLQIILQTINVVLGFKGR